MIEFYSETDFQLSKQDEIRRWIVTVIEDRKFSLGELCYNFLDDEGLLKINLEYLNHDTYTDIISFDYTMGNEIHGEIFISIDRVLENAKEYNVSFEDELHRVMIHGVLHYCGLRDKTTEEESEMRNAENNALLQRDFV